jgi:hypothetical protein
VSRTFEACSRLILGMKVHELNAQPKVFRRHLVCPLPSCKAEFSVRDHPRPFSASNSWTIELGIQLHESVQNNIGNDSLHVRAP